jgi:hypothetical protein
VNDELLDLKGSCHGKSLSGQSSANASTEQKQNKKNKKNPPEPQVSKPNPE